MKFEGEKNCYSRGPEPGSVLRWVVDQSSRKLRKRGIATQLRGPTETQTVWHGVFLNKVLNR
jgi:hypothetical protein